MPAIQRPDWTDLKDFFGGDPVIVESHPLWYFETQDERQVGLRVGVSEVESSVQTDLTIAGRKLDTVSCEGLEAICIKDGTLFFFFRFSDSKAKLEIKVSPEISVYWATLRT